MLEAAIDGHDQRVVRPLALVARLRAEYEKSLGVLLPIKDRLAGTDALIDQIVYQLYGLTEEEIDVLEGRK